MQDRRLRGWGRRHPQWGHKWWRLRTRHHLRRKSGRRFDMRRGALLRTRCRRLTAEKLLKAMNAGRQLPNLPKQLLEFRLRYLHSAPVVVGLIMKQVRGVFTCCLAGVTAKDTYSFRDNKARQLRGALIALGD